MTPSRAACATASVRPTASSSVQAARRSRSSASGRSGPRRGPARPWRRGWQAPRTGPASERMEWVWSWGLRTVSALDVPLARRSAYCPGGQPQTTGTRRTRQARPRSTTIRYRRVLSRQGSFGGHAKSQITSHGWSQSAPLDRLRQPPSRRYHVGPHNPAYRARARRAPGAPICRAAGDSRCWSRRCRPASGYGQVTASTPTRHGRSYGRLARAARLCSSRRRRGLSLAESANLSGDKRT